MLYGYMDPLTEKVFGVYDEIHWVEVRDAFRRAFGKQHFPERDLEGLVTVSDFSLWLEELFKKDIKSYKKITDSLVGDKVLTKGKLARTVMVLLKEPPTANTNNN